MKLWGWMPGIQRQTQRTHNKDKTPTVPSLAPLPFLSGNSNPVPPEEYKETSVGTGQLLAVSSVISYICPSIGCRCQFRPNRCMAVVSNEKNHLWGALASLPRRFFFFEICTFIPLIPTLARRQHQNWDTSRWCVDLQWFWWFGPGIYKRMLSPFFLTITCKNEWPRSPK